MSPIQETQHPLENVLIHIGYHKTASTWLQMDIFNKNKNLFAALSPDQLLPSRLKHKFWGDEEGFLLNPFDTNQSIIQKELAQLCATQSAENKIQVFSHEGLSGAPHGGGQNAQSVLIRLQKTFPSAKILIVIREQRSWVFSNYFQYLKGGGMHRLKDYLKSPNYDLKRPHFTPHHICYHHLIKAYMDAFGNNKVLVLPYEQLEENPEMFLQRLGEFLGIEIPYFAQQTQLRRNVVKNHAHAYRMRHLNKFIYSSSINDFSSKNWKPLKSIAWLIRANSEWLFSKSANQRLTESLKIEIDQWVKGRYQASNTETSQLTSLNLKEYGYMVEEY